MHIKKICFLVIVLFCSTEGWAQYGGFNGFDYRSQARRDAEYLKTYKKRKENGDNVDMYYRREFLLNYCPISVNYKMDYYYTSETGGAIYEGVVESKISATGYSVGGGFYIPLNKIDDKSLIALVSGFNIAEFKFKFDEIRLNGGYKFTPKSEILQFSAPFVLAYKSGTDVAFRKNVKSGFSIGGGAILDVNMGNLNEHGRTKYLLRPYGMAEVAFYTKFCWKIRASGSLGSVNYFTGGGPVHSGGGSESTQTFKNNGNIMLSLVFTEFSWDWDEE